MLNKKDVLSLELAQDVILVKGKAEVRRASGIILDDKTATMEEFRTFDYEIVKIHPNCFTKGDFTNAAGPQVGDTVIVNKYDAKKIFQDKEEIEEDGYVYRITYYLIKDTNVQAYFKKED